MYSLCVGFIKFLHIIKVIVISKYAFIFILNELETWTDSAEHLGMVLQITYFRDTIYMPQCQKKNPKKPTPNNPGSWPEHSHLAKRN